MEETAHKAPEKIDLAVGGQALIEGVMMRSPSFIAIAVRKHDGSIKVKKNPFKSITIKHKLLGLPFVRGIVNLFEMVIVGMNAVNFSAEEYAEDFDEEDEAKTAEASNKETKVTQTTEKDKKKTWFEIAVFAFSILLSFALAIFLFKFIPLYVTELLRKLFPFIEKYYIVFNLIDGLLRISIFMLYVFTLSLFKTFARLFEYHGAEHMAVHTYEKHLPLEVEHAKKQSRLHPRCGTSFLLVIFIISIVIYTFVPRNPIFWENLGQRLLILPLIASIGYEILKWSAKHMQSIVVRILVAPGLWSQRLTTKKPDDKQLEVALEALKATL